MTQLKRKIQATSQAPSKKRKVGSHSKYPKKQNQKLPTAKKEKLADRGIIPIPEAADDDADLSEQDLDVLETFGPGVSFLQSLDHKGISRSKKETIRLHELNKPAPQTRQDDDLPSIGTHSDDEESWSSGIDDISLNHSEVDDSGSEESLPADERNNSNGEMPYERGVRRGWARDKPIAQPLPIKHPDGRIQAIQGKPSTKPSSSGGSEDDSEPSEDEDEDEFPLPDQPDETTITGARFGRLAISDVVGIRSRKARVQAAKDQIAILCQDIIADPENNLGLLRRLLAFSFNKIPSPNQGTSVQNDPFIRRLAILSQLAVFKDIIPGYRIRPLTDQEKTEKVSQAVSHTREWEQGLVIIYQSYLRLLEAELKARTDLAECALKCLCTLLAEVTHFNFRVNIMTCVVTWLSKKSWDKTSDLCAQTIIKVFQGDNTGAASLEVVRLMNRMVKERHFNIHPEVLSCLLHLRLKTELGIRASNSAADKEDAPKPYRKKRKHEQPHLSKKAKKVLKEQKEIQKEFREAEAVVDREERASTQTETLKLLFVLYFRILKHPVPSPLLPAALHGISKYAHLVNIDFFKDLMKVLKDLVDVEDVDTSSGDDVARMYRRLLCIVTAFELLSGQGEALNIDLTDFITQLYALILPISLMPNIEDSSPRGSTTSKRGPMSVSDMLFRALNIVFSPRTLGKSAPPWRSAAFAKRLLSASIHWPPSLALRSLDFVGGLIAKDAKLEALLSTQDRTFDGIHRPDVDDPQLSYPFGSSFWELHLLAAKHWDSTVREESRKLLSFSRS